MNDDAIFLPGVIAGVLLTLLVLFVTPVTDGVRAEDYVRSVKACEPHDGVKVVRRPHYFNDMYRTVCVDGVVIEQLTFQD